MTTATDRRRLQAGLVLLAAVVAACEASPLPYPPDLRTDLLSLTTGAHGDLVLAGGPGAARPPGMELRARNATRPAEPAATRVAGDGSFTLAVDGDLADTLRLDRLASAGTSVLVHVASAGEPDVRRVPAPADTDGDGWADDIDCGAADPHSFPGAAEVCDAVDNDCDGATDETPICGGLPCAADADCADAAFCDGSETCTLGTCAAGPLPSCDDGLPDTIDVCDPSLGACVNEPPPLPVCGNGLREAGEECDDGNVTGGDGCEADCTAAACTPLPEECNGLDDDCDGVADEDFDLLSDELNCGMCGNVCAAGQECLRGVCTA
jgi:cysteine-rich repeat protein